MGPLSARRKTCRTGCHNCHLNWFAEPVLVTRREHRQGRSFRYRRRRFTSDRWRFSSTRRTCDPLVGLVGFRVGYVQIFNGPKVAMVQAIFQKGNTYIDGQPSSGAIPDDMESQEHAVHDALVEGIVVADDELMERYRIDAVPTFIVNGKYETDVAKAGSPEQLIQLISDLVASEKHH